MSRPSIPAQPVAAGLLALLGACATPESRVWNLEQLHDGETHHRYQAALESDAGYFFRRQLLGLFQGAGAQYVAENEREQVEDPAGECLSNLIELEQRAREEGDEPDPRHVEWFARIAVEDPSALCRERAVLALADLGARLSVGLPARLGTDQVAAGPEQLAPVLEELVRAVRGLVEGNADLSKELAARCAAVRALDLDLAAARRALRASTELARLAASADRESKELDELVVHLEALSIRRALAATIEDDNELVRAAGVRGVARTGGARAFDVVLFARLDDRSTEPLRALLEELARAGLPQPDPKGPAPKHSSDEWISAIRRIAIEHPVGDMRVRAMLTLQAIAAPEMKTLREEDWLAWWSARRAAAQAAKGGATATAPAPAASPAAATVPPP